MMRFALGIAITLALGVGAMPSAQAQGCLKGAAVGGAQRVIWRDIA
jgi:hypothetical protein